MSKRNKTRNKNRSLETFLANLKKIAHNYRWKFHNGEIRGEPINHKNPEYGNHCCPITAVARSHRVCNVGIGSFRTAGQALRLSDEDITAIVWTADDSIGSHYFSAGLRCRLNEAVGL